MGWRFGLLMKIKIRKTEQRIIEMWADGLSGSKIGKILNITKSTVSGIITRLRMKGVMIERRPGFQKPRKIQSPPKMGKEPPLPTLAPAQGTLSIMDLTATTCRWPYGNTRSPGGVTYCGMNCPVEHVYCEAHRLKARSQRPDQAPV
jgi:hypothetical protein